jgi:hypothetical protein
MFHAAQPIIEHRTGAAPPSLRILITNLACGLWVLAMLVLWVVLMGADLFSKFYLAWGGAVFLAGLMLRFAGPAGPRGALYFGVSVLALILGLAALSYWPNAHKGLTAIFGGGYTLAFATLTVAVAVWLRALAHLQGNCTYDLILRSKYVAFPLAFSIGAALALPLAPLDFDQLIFICILAISAASWATLWAFGKAGLAATPKTLAVAGGLFLLHGGWLLASAGLLAAHHGPASVAGFVIGAYGGLYVLLACTACAEHLRHAVWQATAQKGFPRIGRLITYSARAGFLLSSGVFLAMIVLAHRAVLPSLGSPLADAAVIFTIFSTSSLAIAILGPAQAVLLHAGQRHLVQGAYLAATIVAAPLLVLVVPTWGGTGAALILGCLLYGVQFVLAYAARRKLQIDTSILGWQPSQGHPG